MAVAFYRLLSLNADAFRLSLTADRPLIADNLNISSSLTLTPFSELLQHFISIFLPNIVDKRHHLY